MIAPSSGSWAWERVVAWWRGRVQRRHGRVVTRGLKQAREDMGYPPVARPLPPPPAIPPPPPPPCKFNPADHAMCLTCGEPWSLHENGYCPEWAREA